MKNTPSILFNRAKHILKEGGVISLLIEGFDFLFFRYRFFARYRMYFQYRVYCLYEEMLKERNEADFMPRIQNFTFKIISTSEEANELAADGLDIDADIPDAHHRLDKGAMAFCIFGEGKLVNIIWGAMTDEAKRTIDILPYQVDFSDKEACTAGLLTIPEYRGKGLSTYVAYKAREFLIEKGIVTLRYAISVVNIASQRVIAHFSPKIYANGRYLKVLRWQFWKETPPVSSNHH